MQMPPSAFDSWDMLGSTGTAYRSLQALRNVPQEGQTTNCYGRREKGRKDEQGKEGGRLNNAIQYNQNIAHSSRLLSRIWGADRGGYTLWVVREVRCIFS